MPTARSLWPVLPCHPIRGREPTPTGSSPSPKSPSAAASCSGWTSCAMPRPCNCRMWIWCCATSAGTTPCGWMPRRQRAGASASRSWATSRSLCCRCMKGVWSAGADRPIWTSRISTCPIWASIWVRRTGSCSRARARSGPGWMWSTASPWAGWPMSRYRRCNFNGGTDLSPWPCRPCGGACGPRTRTVTSFPSRGCSSRPTTA